MAAHSVTFLQTDASSAIRIDAADSINNNVVTVKNAPRMLYISQGFKIIIGVLVGGFSCIILALFLFIVYHRNHRVMTLGQGGLLAWMTVCGLVTIVGSVTYLPTHDIFCRLRGPFVLIPATLLAAILVGRLFRVYMTLNVAANLGRSTSASISSKRSGHNSLAASFVSEQRIMKFLSILAFSRPFRNYHGSKPIRTASTLRQQTSLQDTVRLIAVLSLPQTVVQVFRACFYASNVTIEYDSTGTIGKQMCTSNDDGWTKYTGVALLAATYLLAVLVAWYSRDLPTAFNEKDQIFQAATMNGVICFVIIAMIFITESPTTSPNVTVR